MEGILQALSDERKLLQISREKMVKDKEKMNDAKGKCRTERESILEAVAKLSQAERRFESKLVEFEEFAEVSFKFPDMNSHYMILYFLLSHNRLLGRLAS